MQTPAAAPLRTTQPHPDPVTCRDCGTRHHATVCPVCKEPTRSFVVIRGKVST